MVFNVKCWIISLKLLRKIKFAICRHNILTTLRILSLLLKAIGGKLEIAGT